MNTIELRQKIEHNLLKISPENLKVIDEFVEFLKQKEQTNLGKTINYREASGGSILDHAGKWEGDDLEECLELMYETRGKVTINNRINPFK